MTPQRTEVLNIELDALAKRQIVVEGSAEFAQLAFNGRSLIHGVQQPDARANRIGFLGRDLRSSGATIAEGDFDPGTLAVAAGQVVFADGEHLYSFPSPD